jgi:chorismate dehydratase
VELVRARPLELQERTLDGGLDAAFLPPAVVAGRGDRLSALGGWGLASDGKTETAVLLSPSRIDLIHEESVTVSPEAEGSTAEHLLRILLAPYYGIELAIHIQGDSLQDAGGARLLYADDAPRLATGRKGWVAEDLGVAAWVFTGVPTVWEMLAARRDLEERKPGAGEQVQSLLAASRRAAREQQSTILAEAAQRLQIPQAQVKELFARQRYTLGPDEQKGLARFLDLAARAKLL